jgi:hypothetical protein
MVAMVAMVDIPILFSSQRFFTSGQWHVSVSLRFSTSSDLPFFCLDRNHSSQQTAKQLGVLVRDISEITFKASVFRVPRFFGGEKQRALDHACDLVGLARDAPATRIAFGDRHQGSNVRHDVSSFVQFG